MIIGFMLFRDARHGELLLSNLEYKSFSDFASDLLGPWAGYFTGWTYWFCWVVTGMADVVAITAYAQFWFPGLSDWVASLAVVVLLLSLNLATVKMFGEMEFWFAMVKIVAIVALIVVGLVMIAMHFKSPTGVEASFAHLWNDGGWFPKGISGFFAGFRLRCSPSWALSWSVLPPQKLRSGKIAAARDQLNTDPYHHVLRLCADCHYVGDAVEFRGAG